MNFYGYEFARESDLQHYGLKGMHWGTRRWQNPDGTFNAAGYQRYFGRGTGEDYHPVGRSSSSRKSAGTSEGSRKSFDREKAKKIAKGVAIGAAVVGGTVLVAYGAKHLKDTDVLGKMREGRLANAKAFEKYKTEKLQIKLEGKEMRAKIRDDFKNGMAAIEMDPEGRLKPEILRSEIAGSHDREKLKEFVKSLNDDEVARINSGAMSFHDIRKERGINGWSPNQEKYADYYEKFKDYYGDKNEVAKTLAENVGDAVGKATTKGLQATGKAAKKVYETATSEQAQQAYKNVAKTAGETAKKAYKAATSEQAKAGYKKAAQATGQVAKKAYKAATSEQAKNAVKKTATATKNGIKTAAEITKSTVEVAKLASRHPQETKAAMDYTAQLLRNMQGISAANARNSQTVSRSNATEQYNARVLARQYRRDHPNTKLSDQEIARNMGYGL